MKEAIGGTWLFGIVITFIVFFTTFVSFSANSSRTFKVKDEILTIIELYKGVNSNTVKKINSRMKDLGYASTGVCSDNSGEINSSVKNYSHWLGFQIGNTNAIVSGKNSGPITQVGTIKDVTPKLLKGKKVFEVPGNLITAYKVDLKINIRNQVYTIKAVEKKC